MDRHRERVEHEELLAGIIASTAANFSFCTPKKALTPADFMPSKWSQKKPKKKRTNRKQIAHSIGMFLRAAVEAQKK
jgi:hypothetical protein